jgi:uncharacterized protein YeeX (DUF496 family)
MNKNKLKRALKKAKGKVKVNRHAVTIYVPISHHMYHDGNSYRVRACIQGVKHTGSFSSKKEAYKFRKQLLS